ncbi:hypothetical protein ACFWBN_13205 [Streptomyces sp. NPDC059989]|uniref:hypothetical protein n=1 Tax=Streptomyces sp. NPDC059989 TaxID=3347026 RepID=UPI00368A991F
MIAEHDTWISMDPVVGCPADCGYCYLGTLGLRATKPRMRVTPQRMAQELHGYLNGRRATLIDPLDDPTPLCFGNYTDMAMTKDNAAMIVATIEELSQLIPPRPTVLITKAAVSESLVAELDALEWPIVWFFSQSFARDQGIELERGRIADFETTLRNARLVSASRRQSAVHFWRPFVRELSHPLADYHTVVHRLRDAGVRASVVAGMRLGPGVPSDDPRVLAHLPSCAEAKPDQREVFDRAGWKELLAAAKAAGYPVYRHSSCALALVRSAREQLGTWRTDVFTDRCIPCSCPAPQRARCGKRRMAEADDTDAADDFCGRLAAFLDVSRDAVSFDAKTGCIEIFADVSDLEYNTILHAASGRYLPVLKSVGFERAWQSAWSIKARQLLEDQPTGGPE